MKKEVKKEQREKNNNFFPKIFRFITESWKLILVSFISGLLLIGIVLQGIKLFHNLEEKRMIQAERGKIEKELTFWKGEQRRYPNYRDIYFKIASLHYQLGNKEEAKVSLDKALEIDPNFENGRELEKLLAK